MGSPRFELSIRSHFSAAHHLTGYQGDCGNIHGHNWLVQVAIVSETLDSAGIAVDFRQVKTLVASVLSRLDHTDLNTLKAFENKSPTTEHIAQHIYRELSGALSQLPVTLATVTLDETPNYRVVYWEQQ